MNWLVCAVTADRHRSQSLEAEDEEDGGGGAMGARPGAAQQRKIIHIRKKIGFWGKIPNGGKIKGAHDGKNVRGE